MKTLKIILTLGIISILFSSCGEKQIEIDQKGEIYYVKGTTELYTGTCTQFHENGKTFYHGTITEGKREGVWIWFYENGLKRLEESYSKGLLNGTRQGFDKNGNPTFIKKYSQGLPI